jgi:hypothetical protein
VENHSEKLFKSNMKNILVFFSLLSLISCKPASTAETTEESSQLSAQDTSVTEILDIPGLNRLWDTDNILNTSESVLYDPINEILYVSCINGVPTSKKDGDGFIARVDLEGRIVEHKWMTGLNAPKGMGQKGNTLYVTDIDRLVAIDIPSGKIIKEWPVKGSTFLNDICVSREGIVYFTDSETSTVYSLLNDEVVVVLVDASLGGTNGIWVDGDYAFLAGHDSGVLHRLNMKTNVSEIIAEGIPGGDGVEPYKGALMVSNWNGQVYHVTFSGEVTLLMDSQGVKLNAADIEVIPEKGLLLVPTFYGNTVTAYELKHYY